MVKKTYKQRRCLTVPFSPSQWTAAFELSSLFFCFRSGESQWFRETGKTRRGKATEFSVSWFLLNQKHQNFIKLESWITLYEEAHRYCTQPQCPVYDFYYRLKVQTRYLLTAVVQGRIFFWFFLNEFLKMEHLTLLRIILLSGFLNSRYGTGILIPYGYDGKINLDKIVWKKF